jgi:hypothetical protein
MVNFSSLPGVVTLKEKALKRARELGRNVANAASMPIDQVRFVGEEPENSCPVCHLNVLQMGSNLPPGVVPEPDFFDLSMVDGFMRKSPPDGSYVVCPICDVWGHLEIRNGRIKILWDEESVKHPRFGVELGKHFELIKGIHMEAYKHEDTIKENKKRYRSSVTIVKPPRLSASE